MKRVKITVLRRTTQDDLIKEYRVPGFGRCKAFEDGQVFYTGFGKPDGFCDEAWKAIYQYVFAVAHGGEDMVFYPGSWINRPNLAIASCNDGLRPVIFKIEPAEE